MPKEIYYQDKEGKILSLDKIAFRNCADIVVDKKYERLEYAAKNEEYLEVLFAVQNKKDITIYGTLNRKMYLGWDISKGIIKPLTIMHDHEEVARNVARKVVASNENNEKLLEGKILVNLSHGVAVFEYDINFENLLRKECIKGGN